MDFREAKQPRAPKPSQGRRAARCGRLSLCCAAALAAARGAVRDGDGRCFATTRAGLLRRAPHALSLLGGAQRAAAASALPRRRVAVLQDQQVPKDEAIEALEAKGFDVAWSLDQPSDAWAIVTVTAPVTEEVLSRHPSCKLVAVSFTGFNQVDIEACKRRGIAVVNVPAYSTDAVAEMSVGLALAVYREIPGAERTIRNGGWVHSSGGFELRNKIIGIVGLGAIGLRAAQLFRAFGPRELLGWSRSEKPAFAAPPISGRRVRLEEIFERADVVSVHVALNAETRGLIGRDLLRRLRPEAVLVNVARGGVMDQRALAELLSQRRFRAGLDVFESEPIPADDPILQVPADQVVLTPHLAYKSAEALRRRLAVTAENLRAFADGAPQNVVLRAAA